MQNARWAARRPLAPLSTPSSLGARQMQALDRGHHALAAELGRDRGARQNHHALARVAEPARVAYGVAVRAQRAHDRVDLLDTAVPEVAAVVGHVVAGQLL